MADGMASSRPGLSRLWCATCQEERIHKGGVCSCGTKHVAYPVKNIAMYLRQSIKVERKR